MSLSLLRSLHASRMHIEFGTSVLFQFQASAKVRNARSDTCPLLRRKLVVPHRVTSSPSRRGLIVAHGASQLTEPQIPHLPQKARSNLRKISIRDRRQDPATTMATGLNPDKLQRARRSCQRGDDSRLESSRSNGHKIIRFFKSHCFLSIDKPGVSGRTYFCFSAHSKWALSAPKPSPPF